MQIPHEIAGTRALNRLPPSLAGFGRPVFGTLVPIPPAQIEKRGESLVLKCDCRQVLLFKRTIRLSRVGHGFVVILRAWISAAVLCALAFALAGCNPYGQLEDYKEMVRSGLQTLPWPNEIESVFGDADHFITHWNFDSSKTRTWNTEVHFRGRYSITMQVQVEVDYHNRKVVRAVSSPRFFFLEYEKIIVEPGGGVTGNLVGSGAPIQIKPTGKDDPWGSSEKPAKGEFDLDKWRLLLKSKGDLSVLGLGSGDTNPVVDFDALVKATRRDRVKVK